MRLKHIKLAGFKSFVDITTVPFPQSMTAIVGPNGCGKSNIIDAVRWVLGESSAKNLRGDSMTDVIFNGSSVRKPVGQASVELLFDNSQLRLQGSMADRTEISIRRVVNRDSQNTYYLNGSKCRRKDITDIFLGTGLGPRSYAIIEQGMISKLIESKPQELRVFIEEAAGVSKYKERRRETETRIRHTRENLSRLADIRQELGTQIEKLDGQAQAATRFRTLKTKERNLKAELTVLRWQQCQQNIEQYNLNVLKVEHQIDQILAQQSSADLTKVDDQLKQQQYTENLTKLQQKKLMLTSHISRLEQNVKHAKQKTLTLHQDLLNVVENINEVSKHLTVNVDKKTASEQSIHKLEPLLIAAEKSTQNYHREILDLHRRKKAWQQHWDNYQQQQAHYTQQSNVLEANIKSAHLLMTKTEHRIAHLNMQLNQHNVNELLLETDSKRTLLHQSKQQYVEIEQQLNTAIEKYECSVQRLNSVIEKKSQQQLNVQDLSSQVHTLASVNSQQSDWQLEQESFLQSLGYQNKNQLLSALTVTVGWEYAIDIVVGQWLKATVVKHFPESIELPNAMMTLQKTSGENVANPGTLAACIQGKHPFTPYLNTIIVVDTEQLAHQASNTLSINQSVICKQGLWIGNGWLRKGSFEHQNGLLTQRTQMLNAQIDLAASEQLSLKLAKTITELQHQNSLLNAERIELQNQASEKSAFIEKIQQSVVLLEQEISLKSAQVVHVKDELNDQENALESELSRYQQLLKQQSSLQKNHDKEIAVRQVLQNEKASLNLQIDNKQRDHKRSNDEVQQFKLELEKNKVEGIGLQSAITRDQQQLLRLQQQQQQLLDTQSQNQLPIVDDEKKLTELIEESGNIDTQQQTLNQVLATVSSKIERFNVQQQELNSKVAKERDKLSKYHVNAETFKVRSKAALEQLAEMQQNLDDVVKRLPIGAKEGPWQLQLTNVNKDISELGAINLAAIEEFKLQTERKQFLDKQNADLESSISTLESAIHKIDKETRQKFKDTFEQVNSDLKLLFPKVFGGGNAYLDLTGDDLLDAGVTIMARPPGKKNSTIHLLSGGEKALTALSLVFAIFRLNPAPFCLLDEVDAPLDDANVGRFCKLVEEMSQTVQFIYISHNKIAMEMASHLTGVTMHEPGVSRMVAVDIDEAVAMAEAV